MARTALSTYSGVALDGQLRPGHCRVGAGLPLSRRSVASLRLVSPRPSTSRAKLLAAALVTASCAPEENDLPEPPKDAELVLALQDLEIYKVQDAELCAGTLRRIELQVAALGEVFKMDPPHALVVLYDDPAQVSDLCRASVDIEGCAPSWGALATPASVLHELVHVFVHEATGDAQTRPFIEEGVAWRLEGRSVLATSLISLEGFQAQLAMRSPHDLPYGEASEFFAWAIDTFGIESVMDAHVAMAAAETDEGVEDALSHSLGFTSLSDLHAAYVENHAAYYPPLPDTVRVLSAAELAEGVSIDLTCGGAYTEGPADWAKWDPRMFPEQKYDQSREWTTIRLEIAEPGVYEIQHNPLPFSIYPSTPSLLPTTVLSESLDGYLEQPEQCGSGVPPFFLFGSSGQYESVLANPLGESVRADISVIALGLIECMD